MFYSRFVYFDQEPEGVEPGSIDGPVQDIEATDADRDLANLSEEVEINSPIANLDKDAILDEFAHVQIGGRRLIAILGDDLTRADNPLKSLSARELVVNILARTGLEETNPEFITNMREAIETEEQTGEMDQVMYEQYLQVLETLKSYLARVEELVGPMETRGDRMMNGTARTMDNIARNVERAGPLGQTVLFGGAAIMAAALLLRGGKTAERIRQILGWVIGGAAVAAAGVWILPRTITGRTMPEWFRHWNRGGINRGVAEYFGSEYETDEEKATVDALMASLNNDRVANLDFADLVNSYRSGLDNDQADREIPFSIVGSSQNFDTPEARRSLFGGIGLVYDKYGPGSALYRDNQAVRTTWENAMLGRKSWSETVLTLMGDDDGSQHLFDTYLEGMATGIGGFARRRYERVRHSDFVDNAVSGVLDEFDDVRDKMRDVAGDLPHGDKLLEFLERREYPQEYLREHSAYRLNEPSDILDIPNVQFADLALAAYNLDENGEGIYEDAVGMQYTLVRVRIERPYRDHIVEAMANSFSQGVERFTENGDANEANVMFGGIDREHGYYYLAMFNRPQHSLAMNADLKFSAFPEDDFEEFNGYIDSRLLLEVMNSYQLNVDQATSVINHFAQQERDGENLFNYLGEYTEHRDEVAEFLGAGYAFNQTGWEFYQDMMTATLENMNGLVPSNDAVVNLMMIYSAATLDEDVARRLGLENASYDQVMDAYLAELAEFTGDSETGQAEAVSEQVDFSEYYDSVANFAVDERVSALETRRTAFNGVLVHRDEGRTIFAVNYHSVGDNEFVQLQRDNGAEASAAVVETDPANDLALIELDRRQSRDYEDAAVMQFADARPQDDARIRMIDSRGDGMIIEGLIEHDLDDHHEQIMDNFAADSTNMTATTINSSPGQSGSPVLNDNGELVGIIIGEFGTVDSNTGDERTMYGSMLRAEAIEALLADYLAA